VTPTHIQNRTRRIVLSAGTFASYSGIANVANNASATNSTIGASNFSVATFRNRALAATLGNDVGNVATTTFVVPNDYLTGQSIPKLTIYWATDEGAAARQVDVDVSFVKVGDITSPTSAVTFRYNFRNSSGASTNAMDSANPAQGQIVAQTLPENAETYDNTPAAWAPGDIIILSIGRNGTSGSDPNGGNMYIYGVAFDYTSDM
jgi:hypothetical protein